MTVHFFTKGDERLADSRQRAFRIADELNAIGIKTVMHTPSVTLIATTPWPKKFLLILATLRSLFLIKKGDIVFLQRTVGSKYFFIIMVAYLKFFRRKMIFDFDDAIYMYDPLKTRTLTKMADAVIVCSHALEQWARRYNTNVHIIHTTVKLSDYEKFTKNYSTGSRPLVIGWIGTARYHYKNLQLLAAVFTKLVTQAKATFKFVLIGAEYDKKIYDLFKNIHGLHVEFINSLDWNNPESVPREIQKFDIGANPLVDRGEWNLARSSFKPLEYMACGVATMSSAVGEITYVIQDGINGYLANNEDEWVEKLQKLLSDTKLRTKLSRAGQERIRKEYSYEAIIPRLLSIIKTLG